MELILVRGLPGSGKSTFAAKLNGTVFEADQYFTLNSMGEKYEYDPEKVPEAHKWCQKSVLHSMNHSMARIIVANTFVKRWEMQPYLDMAKEQGYTVTEITMSGPVYPNVHRVPASKIQRMTDNWEK